MSDVTDLQLSTKLATTFFDLPSEIRLQIYDYLLPSRGKLFGWAFSLAFLRTNRQIHEEACEAFYGSGSFDVTIHGWSVARTTGYVSFLTQAVDTDDVPDAACFALLKRIKHLRLRVQAHGHPRAICEAQDVLTSLRRRIDGVHNLEKLEVNVNITQPIRMIPAIKPQEIAPAVLINFITEPLRAIRNNTGIPLELTVSADEGQPLPDITETIHKTINGNDAIPVTDGFSRYFVILRRMFRVAQALPDYAVVKSCDELLATLCRARILGNLDDFESVHQALVAKMQNLASAALKASMASTKVGLNRTQLMQNVLALHEAMAEVAEVGGIHRFDQEDEVNLSGHGTKSGAKKRKCEAAGLEEGRKKVRVVEMDGSSFSGSLR